MRAAIGIVSLACALVIASACGPARHGPSAAPPAERFDETGLASWYGSRHHGRTTASGEPFDMHAMTAAHRTLPFGTRVEVVRLDTGARVRVRINDRGPFVDGRVVDLSREAARRLDMIDRGVVRVGLRVLDRPGARW